MHAIDRRTMLVGSASLLGLGLLTLAGCARDQPAPSPTPSTPDTIDDALPDLELTRMYGQEVTAATSFYAMALAAGRVLLYDDTDAIEGRLAVLDAASGGTLWTWAQVDPAISAVDPALSALAPTAFAIAGSGDEAVLAAPTYLNPCPGNAAACASDVTERTDGRGVVALSLESGAVRWHALLIPPVDRADPQAQLVEDAAAEPVGGTDDLVIVRVGLADHAIGGSAPRDPRDARTVALSVTDGTVVWEQPGFVATSVGDDVVVGLLRTDAGEGAVVVDAASGEALWRAEPGQRVSPPVAGALVVWTDDGTDPGRLVDARTGADRTTLDDGTALSVAGATLGTSAGDEPMVAWVASSYDPDDALQGYRLWSTLGDEPAPGAEELDDSASVPLVADGYVWCTDGDRLIARDRSGAPRSEPVRGTMRGVEDGRLLVETDGGFEVYEIR